MLFDIRIVDVDADAKSKFEEKKDDKNKQTSKQTCDTNTSIWIRDLPTQRDPKILY